MRKIQRHIKQNIKKIARFFDSDKRIERIFISEDFLSVVKPYSRRLKDKDYIVCDDEQTFSVEMQTTKFELNSFSTESEHTKYSFCDICYNNDFPYEIKLLFNLLIDSDTVHPTRKITEIIKNADSVIEDEAQNYLISTIIDDYLDEYLSHKKKESDIVRNVNDLIYITDKKGSKESTTLAYDIFNHTREYIQHPPAAFDTCVIHGTGNFDFWDISLGKSRGDIIISANGKIYHYKFINRYSFYCVYSENDDISITLNDITVTANSEGVRELKTIMEMLAY